MLRSYSKGLIMPTVAEVAVGWHGIAALIAMKGNISIYLWGGYHANLSYCVNGVRINTVNFTATYFDVNNITYCTVADNGNVVIIGKKKDVWYSDDNCLTFQQSTVLGLDGQPYVYHTPVNPDMPGDYWCNVDCICQEQGVILAGNYGNVYNGAVPCNLYYSKDGGAIWKLIYQFGQNPTYRDDGTANGSNTEGNLLGDANNPYVARHWHGINYSEGTFWGATGEGIGDQIHWFKMVYNSISDTWAFTELLDESVMTFQRLRAEGFYRKDGYYYWGSDGAGTTVQNGVTYQNLGIFRCPVADISDLSKHELLEECPSTVISFINKDNIVFAGFHGIYSDYDFMSFNWGKNWTRVHKPVGNTTNPFYTFLDNENRKLCFGYHKILDWNL